MINRAAAILIILLFGLASCAPHSSTVRPDTGSQAPVEKESPIVLPDLTIEGDTEVAQPKPQPKPAALEAYVVEDEGEDKFIILNFENTDIQTIVATFGELLGINYMLSPEISGTVTIHSYSKFPIKNLFQIFQSILETNGLTAIKDGDFYRIVSIDTAKDQPIDIAKGRAISKNLDSDFVTQLISLENVKASDISNILKNIMPRGSNLIVYEPANMLIVTALPQTLAKFIKIVEAIDVSDSESEAIRTYVYYVENGEAQKLADILKTIYVAEGDAVVAGSATTTTAAAPAATPKRTTRTSAPAQAASNLPGDIGDVSITAYEDINALIIKSSPRSYLSLLQVLEKIDVPPKQVLIEVIIAEVGLSDTLEYGLEWFLQNGKGDVAGFNRGRFVSEGALLSPIETNVDTGMFTTVIQANSGNSTISTLLEALATDTDLNVLASPNILAVDNKEAQIKIGSEVPTATSTTQSSEGTTTSSEIQYKTVGTLLTVTPHITEKGNVSMKIVVESSDIGADTIIGSGSYPSFVTRNASTNAVVHNGHTLFLGGLISEKRSNTRTGIPFLTDIPFIGWLFGSVSKDHEKTEMFLMVTPRVVSSIGEADELSKKFQSRVRVIKDNIAGIKQEKESNEKDEATAN